jgi:Domain of unknown function (DUF4105)
VRRRGDPLRIVALCLALAALPACVTTQARADRDWMPYLARTAHVELSAERFSVAPVSDWSYAPAGPTAENYGEAGFDFAALRHVWFVLEPRPGSKLAAHTLLLFEFEGDRLLGLTIEARRENNEAYSAPRGVFNAYELSYLWASARDLLTRRAVLLDHEVFVYPLTLSEDQQQMLLRRVLERTFALEQQPRFYNTLFSNCTNELAKAAGLDWHSSFILTGTSDNYLFRRGLIPGESFAAAEARANLTDFIKQANDAPAQEFDSALLARLRAQ